MVSKDLLPEFRGLAGRRHTLTVGLSEIEGCCYSTFHCSKSAFEHEHVCVYVLS